jgi:hypothetical protein
MKMRKKTNFAPDAMEFHIPTSHSIYTVILIPNTSGAGTTYPSGAHVFKPGFIGVRVTRSEVLYICFVDRCLSFCPFSFANCVVKLPNKQGMVKINNNPETQHSTRGA